MGNDLQPALGDNKGYIPVAYKLAVLISILIISGMSLLGLLIAREQSLLIEQQTRHFSNTLVTQIAEGSKESLLANDLLALEIAISNLLTHEMILGAALYTDEFESVTRSGLIPETLPPLSQEKDGVLYWKKHDSATPLSLASHIQVITVRNVVVGYALITFNHSLVKKSQQQTIKAVMGITLLFVIIGIIAAFIISRRITRPIQDLLHASHAISMGKYDTPLLQMRNDEIGVLMNSLNSISKGLLRRDQVEKTFSKYVSPEIAQTILNDLEEVNLGGEKVNASVLFADIVGFTKLSEELEPQDLNALLNEYFSLIAKAAQAFNGYVDKYIGDCAMLVFGIPKNSDSQHSRDALACAVLIHRLVERINQQRSKNNQPTVLFRIGVNSGEMLAGNMGAVDRMEYTVIGDAVNIAARLSAAASPGETIISEELNNALAPKGCIDSLQNGTLRFHGKEKPISTYIITGLTNKLFDQVEAALGEILPP